MIKVRLMKMLDKWHLHKNPSSGKWNPDPPSEMKLDPYHPKTPDNNQPKLAGKKLRIFKL